MSNIYTSKDLDAQASHGEISLNDIVMLNGNNIVSSINITSPVDGKLNPIPSYDAVVETATYISGQLSTAQENVQSAFSRIGGIDEKIESMSASYELTSDSRTSVITSLDQTDGKISVQAKRLVSSDIGQLDGLVTDAIGVAKTYVNDSFLPLSGGEMAGNLVISRDYGLSVTDGIDNISANGETLRKIIDDSISLSTGNAVKKLSDDLNIDFGFGYDRNSNTISAHVAGKTLSFSADRFTEATMLSNVHVDQNGLLWLIFKTEDPTAQTIVSVDLKEIMPLYDGESGIDIKYNGHGRYVVSADSSIARQSTINELSVVNAIQPGMILSALSQENGKIAYSAMPILSSYVNGLSDYVSYALSAFNLPLSANYTDWTTFPSTVNGNDIQILDYIEDQQKMFVPCINSIPQGPAKEVSQDDPYTLFWDESELTGQLIAGIGDNLTATRSAVKYILGHHIDKPIQPYGDYATNSDLQLSVNNLLDALSGDISCNSLTTPTLHVENGEISSLSTSSANANELYASSLTASTITALTAGIGSFSVSSTLTADQNGALLGTASRGAYYSHNTQTGVESFTLTADSAYLTSLTTVYNATIGNGMKGAVLTSDQTGLFFTLTADLLSADSLTANALTAYNNVQIGGNGIKGAQYSYYDDGTGTMAESFTLTADTVNATLLYANDNSHYASYEPTQIIMDGNVVLEAGTISSLSSSISAMSNSISSLSNDLSALSSDVVDAVSALSTAVDNKIYIDDRIDQTISGNSDLSIVKLPKEEYELLAIGPTPLSANVLYVVESDYIDAYGQQIKNLSAGTELSDAVNVGQLAASENSIKQWIDDNFIRNTTDVATKQYVNNKLSALIADPTISAFYNAASADVEAVSPSEIAAALVKVIGYFSSIA